MRFAGDIVIIADNIKDINIMLQDLQACSLIWLKINMSKTKFWTNLFRNENIVIDNWNINQTCNWKEELSSLGQRMANSNTYSKEVQFALKNKVCPSELFNVRWKDRCLVCYCSPILETKICVWDMIYQIAKLKWN